MKGEPIESANGVAFEWTFAGTNTGAWGPDTPATGKPFNFNGVTFMRVENGKIVYQGDYYDGLGFQKQLGPVMSFDTDLIGWKWYQDQRNHDVNLFFDPVTGYNKDPRTAGRPNPAYGQVIPVTGTGELVGLVIKPEAADPDDTETLADLVVAAVRDANARAMALAQATLPPMPEVGM